MKEAAEELKKHGVEDSVSEGILRTIMSIPEGQRSDQFSQQLEVMKNRGRAASVGVSGPRVNQEGGLATIQENVTSEITTSPKRHVGPKSEVVDKIQENRILDKLFEDYKKTYTDKAHLPFICGISRVCSKGKCKSR